MHAAPAPPEQQQTSPAARNGTFSTAPNSQYSAVLGRRPAVQDAEERRERRRREHEQRDRPRGQVRPAPPGEPGHQRGEHHRDDRRGQRKDATGVRCAVGGVAASPTGPPRRGRSARRRTLPVRWWGSSSTISTSLGILNRARNRPTAVDQRLRRRRLRRAPGPPAPSPPRRSGGRARRPRPPRRRSGTAMASSTSFGYTLNPRHDDQVLLPVDQEQVAVLVAVRRRRRSGATRPRRAPRPSPRAGPSTRRNTFGPLTTISPGSPSSTSSPSRPSTSRTSRPGIGSPIEPGLARPPARST